MAAMGAQLGSYSRSTTPRSHRRATAKPMRCSVISGAAAPTVDTRLQLNSSGRSDMSVLAKGDLAAYVKESPAFFGALEMPMGGSLRSVDLDEGVFELTVPRIQLFDLWIQPRATAIIRVEELPSGASRLKVTASKCQLLGSRHVEQFKLNDRFVLDVAINFISDQPKGPGTPGAIRAHGNIGVKVDIPPPFSFMPQHLLQTTGNTALNSTVSILLNSFVNSMVKDFNRWTALQHKKQQAARTASLQ